MCFPREWVGVYQGSRESEESRYRGESVEVASIAVRRVGKVGSLFLFRLHNFNFSITIVSWSRVRNASISSIWINVCRKEEGRGNSVGNFLLQMPETLLQYPSEISGDFACWSAPAGLWITANYCEKQIVLPFKGIWTGCINKLTWMSSHTLQKCPDYWRNSVVWGFLFSSRKNCI